MEIVPISFIDQLIPVHHIRTRTHFIVREHLDVELLRQSLDKLIRGHWRLLGARIATDPENEELVYHLPKVFEDGYSLFGWSSEEVDKPIDDAVPALKRPAAEGVAILPKMDKIGPCFEPADWPTHRRHDTPDSPMIYVHVQSYSDATVVSINFLHVLADQLGLVNIMKAWLGLAGGKEPPPMVGFDKDMFQPKRQFSDYAKSEIERKGMIKLKSPVDSKLVILGLIPEFVYHPRETRRSLFFPLELVTSLRERCAETLRNKYKTDNGISNGDVLTAILTKLARLGSKGRNISLSQTVNLRKRIPKLSGDCSGFVHNALIHAGIHYRHEPSLPISEIARLNRECIARSLEPEEIDKSLAIIQELVKRGQGLHICEPLETSFTVVMWGAIWKDLDFQTVAIKEKPEAEPRKLEAFVLGQSGEPGAPRRFFSTVMCKADDGYWVDFSTTTGRMQLVKEYLARDPRLEAF